MSTTQTNTPVPAAGSPVECPKCKPLASGAPSVRRVKDVVTTEPTVTVRLSCRHVIDMPEAPATETAGAERDSVTYPTDEQVADGEAALAAELEQADVDTPEAETKRGPRVVAASREAKELKAWTDGGEQGPRPATPNLDAIEAESGQKASRDPRAPEAPDADPLKLGLAQGPKGMVDSKAMTPDDPKPVRRTRERKADTASGSKVTDLNLSAPRRAVMLEALPEKPDGEVQDVASVVALRAKVAAGADRVDVDAAGVRALLTGLAPMCAAGNKTACRLNDWLTKYAEEVGYTPAGD